MRGEGQVANRAVRLSALRVVPYTAVHDFVEVSILVDAVDEAEVGIVGAKIGKAFLELCGS